MKFFEPIVSVVEALSAFFVIAAVPSGFAVVVPPLLPELSESSPPQATRPSARANAAIAARAVLMVRVWFMGWS